jgi:hypothetical protein
MKRSASGTKFLDLHNAAMSGAAPQVMSTALDETSETTSSALSARRKAEIT